MITQVLIKEPQHSDLVEEDDIFYQRRTGTAEKVTEKFAAQLKEDHPCTQRISDIRQAAAVEKLRWFN